MGPHEQQARTALKAWDELGLAEEVGVDPDDPNLVLAMLTGVLMHYHPEAYDAGVLPMPTREEADDWLSAVYVVLSHYETNRLSKDVSSD